MFWDTSQLSSGDNSNSKVDEDINRDMNIAAYKAPSSLQSLSSISGLSSYSDNPVRTTKQYTHTCTNAVTKGSYDKPSYNDGNDDTAENREFMAMGRCPSLQDDLIATTDTVAPSPQNATMFESDSHHQQTTTMAKMLNSTKKRKRRDCILEGEIIDHLIGEGFTLGLADSLVENTELFSLRIWLVDNSGSMAKTDGHRIVQSKTSNKVNIIDSSRWEEVSSCVIWHAQLAAVLHSPIVFRFLNDPGSAVGSQQISVAESCYKEYTDCEHSNSTATNNSYDDTLSKQHQQKQRTNELNDEVKKVKRAMHHSRPLGSSPLSEHLRAIHQSVISMQTRILANGKLIALIIATDGLPTDEEGNEHEDANTDFCDALQLFQYLPVVIIIRLSTDEDRVVNFYNELDATLASRGCRNMNIDVLDDFIAEAEEVYEHNPWLNYALPLHLSRESALRHDLLNILDDRHLQPSELRDACQLIFGTSRFNEDVVPDPVENYPAFAKALKSIVDCEQYQWNPIRKKPTPWIDFKELNRIYGHSSTMVETKSSCCIIV